MEINAVTLHKLTEMIFEFQTIQQNITACDFLGVFGKVNTHMKPQNSQYLNSETI